MHIRRHKRVRRNDRGAALMLIAMSLVATVTTAGVIVDGGNAFAQRRQMQNAADDAALAGARALDNLVVNAEAVIWTTVVASAVSNGANASLISCRLTDDLLVDLGACPLVSTGTANSLRATASAVKVTVASTHDTTFVRAAGVEHFTARARATAQIQGLRLGNSPFVICATGINDPRSLGAGQIIPILMPNNTINPSAIGVQYDLQSPGTIGCGQGNTFKGLTADLTTSFPTPGAWGLYNGDHGVNVSSTVVAGNSACRGTLTTGCIINVPLCHAASPPTIYVLYCERMAGFQIVDIQGASKIAGKLVDHVEASGGQGGGHAQPGEVRVIKLSE